MRKALFVILILVFAVSGFADEKKPNQKLMDNYIAVFDVETEGVDKKISRPLTESIRRELVMSGKYEVIDRGNMNKILGEQKLQLSGCVSGQCIVEAGQILGVGKIITGSVSIVGKTFYLTLSLINVETGKIENVSEDECKCEVDDLIKSTKRLVKRLLGEQVTTLETATTSGTTPDIEMVFVKGGCFQMGDTFGDRKSNEKSVHEVCIDDFYIGKYEVTQKQWKEIMGNNNSRENCRENLCPVDMISWNEIQDFITKLNKKTGKNYKLPTEAQWEYAARSGGKKEKYAGTSNEEELGDYAWYDKNSGFGFFKNGKIFPVGQKKPNGLGIYDMSGNVWEWVADWYDENYYKNSPKNNPTGPNNGTEKVLRGGSQLNGTKHMEASARYSYVPTKQYSTFYGDFGFRLLLSEK
ncbi:MAG: SUMF1/EgtB/PvdO family nonheme iron enzyme [Nitrospiraceae bacterium]|nr:SUMF1/EgtB/PvdO family nonheme iron enzyme [Nitrospiraceae bacterium]